MFEESNAYDKAQNLASTLNESQKSDLVAQTTNLWRNWTIQIQQLITESNENWQMYNANKPEMTPMNPGNDSKAVTESRRTGVRLGKIARSLDSVHAVQHNSTFPADESFFESTPNNDIGRTYQEEYETWAEKNLEDGDFITAMYNHRKNCMMDGTTVSACPYIRKVKRKVTYEYPKVKIPVINVELTLDFLPPKKNIDEKAVVYEGTIAKPLNFNDWRADPNVPIFEEAGFLRRWYEDTWKIKRDYDLDEVNPYYTVMEFWDSNIEKTSTAGVDWQWTVGKGEVEGKNKALLMVRYDDFVIDGQTYENHVSIVLNDKQLLWFGPNPYDHQMKPYVLTPYIPIPGLLYGKSAIRDSIIMAHAQDNAATKYLDIMSWGADPVFLVNTNDSAVRAHGQIKIKPGLNIPVSIPGSIEQLPINLAEARSLLELVQLLDQQIENAMGSNPVFSGQDPAQEKGDITAFQVGAHIQGANNVFQSFMGIFNKTTLTPFMMMKWMNDQQFMSKSYFVAGFEAELTPDIIKQMDLDWIITAGDASLARGKEVANLKELITLLPQWRAAGLIQFKQEIAEVDFIGIFKKLLLASGQDDVDKILKITGSNQEVVQAGSNESMMNEGQPENGAPPQQPAGNVGAITGLPNGGLL